MSDNNIPFELVKPERPISNAEFFRTLIARVPDEINGEKPFYWVSYYPGDPKLVGPSAWAGSPLPVEKIDQLGTEPGVNARKLINGFYVVSAFVPAETGQRARSKVCFGAMMVAGLDDLGDPTVEGSGAKVSWDRLRGRPVPSYAVETSPGCYQVGYLLREPIRDRELAETLEVALTFQGLGCTEDPGNLDVTRYLRFGDGVNGKAKYRTRQLPDETGFWDGEETIELPVEESPHCALVHWQPERLYTVDELVAGFELDLEEAKRRGRARRASVGGIGGVVGMPIEDDPWIKALDEAGLIMDDPIDKGDAGTWVPVRCPQVHLHTDGGETGTAYAVGGGFKCHHGHCVDLGWPQVRDGLLRGEHGEEAKKAAQHARIVELFGDGSEWDVEAELAADPSPWAIGGVADEARPMLEIGRGDRRERIPWPRACSLDTLRQRAQTLQREDRDGLISLMRDMWASGLEAVDIADLIDDIADGTGRGKPDLKSTYKSQRSLLDAGVARSQASGETEPEVAEVAEVEGGTVRLPKVRLAPEEWRDLDSDGNPVLSRDNVALVCERMGVDLWYDEMSLEGAATLAGGKKLRSDAIVSHIHDVMMLNGFARATVGNVLVKLRAAAELRRKHPFAAFLDDLRARGGWDGTDRLGALYGALRVPHGHQGRRDYALTRWLYSVIAAARHLYADQPGLQPRLVLILAGGQRIGKSTLFAKLFHGLFPDSDRCFAGGQVFVNDRDVKVRLLSHLVCELGEFDETTRRSTHTQLKQFLSEREDSLRRPYAPADEHIARRTVFVGTINPGGAGFLPDQTGNSRFVTLKVDGIDLNAIDRLDLAQVWAQLDAGCLAAFEGREHDGWAPWLPTDEEYRDLAEANEPHRETSEIEEALRDLYDWEDPRWLQERNSPMHDRVRLNGQTMTDVKQILALRNVRQFRDLRGELVRLTGAQEPLPTHIENRRGRFWPMPPRFIESDTDRADDAFSDL